MKEIRDNYFVHFSALFITVFALVGKPVPYSNDFSYLLRLVNTYNPTFLQNDVTFSSFPNEHWLFNHIFGLLTLIFSVEIVGWLGRFAVWSILIALLLRLGKRWEIPLWMISVSIFIWLCIGQTIVNDEWMFGGFEAKCVAYIFLLLALDRFCDGRDFSSAALLGLCFSFHPLVGLWGVSASIFALLFFHKDLVRTGKVILVSAVFSCIGLIPLLIMKVNSIASDAESLQYLELVKFPFHFDPFSWARSSILFLIFLGGAIAFFHFRKKESETPAAFLVYFLGFLGIFFVAGLFLRVFEQYSLLEFMPMRLFPVFAPLFFLFYFASAYTNKTNKTVLLGVLSLAVIFSAWTKIPLRTYEQVKTTYEHWTEMPDDSAQVFTWIKENTQEDALVIAPPWRYDFWYLSNRAEIVSYNQPIYSNLADWQTRLDKLIGKAKTENGIREDSDLSKVYCGLSEDKIKMISQEYKADYLVSETDYSYPVVYSKGKVKVYSLRPKAAE